MEAFPEEAPPPYSETYEASVYVGAIPQIATTSRHASLAVVDARNEGIDGSQVLNRKAKVAKQNALPPVSKAAIPEEQLLRERHPSRERSKATGYERGNTKVNPRRTVADSEDEIEEQDLEELDEIFWLDAKSSVHSKAQAAHYPVLPKVTPSPKPRPKHADPGTHLRQTEALSTDCSIRHPTNANLPSGSLSLQRHSPTKLPLAQIQQVKSIDFSSSELHPAEKISMKTFLAIELDFVRDYHRELNNARAVVADQLIRRVEQGRDLTAEMQHQSASLRVKIDATEALLRLRRRYDALNQQKEELKVRLIAAIKEERPASEYAKQLHENATVAHNLAEMERQMFGLLAQAEIPLQEKASTRQDKFPETHSFTGEPNQRSMLLVKSTQVPQTLQTDSVPRERVPVPGSLGTTQHHLPSPRVDSDPRTPQKQQSTNKSTTQRKPLQTYMSSPKAMDVTAYFSPSKSKPRQDLCATTNARQVHIENPACPGPAPLSLPCQKNARNYDQEVEDFTWKMASPIRMMIGDEDFGQEEDDEDMLEAAEKCENYGVRSAANSGPTQRIIFAESTGNVVRTEPRKDSAFLPNGHAQASYMQHPWSREVKAAMRERFHLRGFRPNQLEAINATLSGKDTFVLMPTGGGKSLCYQLPSIIRSGKTRGVTVVFSPLLSLMHDQVDHLRKLKIQAFLFNSEVTQEHRSLVMASLRESQVEKFIQLLYITPEMISKSNMMINALRELYERQKLARIVIDEAHCVSEWGHDFRPDYKLLGDVRREFRGVPVMALTATATENAKLDVVHNLGIEGCEVLTQSFNRPNLTYEIRSKGKSKNTLESIATTIKTLYDNQSGIIYCLSRKNCESVAESLRKDHGIRAEHYHAGMDPDSKTSCQKKWQSGEYHVIVATIAFGMGIDKPDVRFVIHHSMPKSLEGYYQETGRAGRDGKRSGCYLYFSYHDTNTHQRMIDNGEGSFEQKERQTQMLRIVKSFCENKSDCRRVQILRYFDEIFRREDCNGACDNCTSKSSFETQDYTDYAVSAIALVQNINKNGMPMTLLHCVDVFRGGKGKKIVSRDHDRLPQHGAGSHLERGDIERLFYRLLSEEALMEKSVVNKNSGFPSKYLYVSFAGFRENEQGLTLSSWVRIIISFPGVRKG